MNNKFVTQASIQNKQSFGKRISNGKLNDDFFQWFSMPVNSKIDTYFLSTLFQNYMFSH